MVLELHAEEIRLLRQFQAARRPASRFTFVAAVLITPIVFFGFGCVVGDYVILALAFLGLLAFTLWFVVHSLRNGSVLAGIADKLLDEHQAPRT